MTSSTPSSPVSEQGRSRSEEDAAAAAQTVDRDHEAGDPSAEDVGQLQARIAELDDRYKRALADLDNYRKRSAREVERRVEEARDALARDWLEAVDSVDRALRAAEPRNPLAAGLRAVLDQMEAALSRHGITRIHAEGQQFDPERHEAVDVRVTDEVDDRTVLEVPRAGYARNGGTLRPAQVIVSRRPGPDG